jgi:hypothetical protein
MRPGLRGILITATAVGSGAVIVGESVSRGLRTTGRLSGWLLLSLVVLLMLFSARKKVPFLPLGSVAAWLDWHAAWGVVSLAVFGVHSGWRLPNGNLEIALSTMFLIVTLTGVLGLWLSRTFARRLATRGQEVIFERIPALRREIRENAEALLLAAAEKRGGTSVGVFYAQRLLPFFERPRNSAAHLLNSDRPLRLLLAEMSALERYLEESERDTLETFRELVAMKDDLDYHRALQGALKAWLFVHVPASWSLLILAFVHGALAQVFAAGTP